MSANISNVVRTMDEFAVNTGLTSSSTPRRYLWTDAFAVCNFLGLQKLTQDERYGRLALELVDSVHNVLGKHRSDDTRKVSVTDWQQTHTWEWMDIPKYLLKSSNYQLTYIKHIFLFSINT